MPTQGTNRPSLHGGSFDEFIAIVQKHFCTIAERNHQSPANLVHLETSCVNFLFSGSLDGEHIILKGNLFGRSMLYAYEQFLEKGRDGFVHFLQDDLSTVVEILREAKELEFLGSLGLQVPVVKGHVEPNMMFLGKIEGVSLDQCFGEKYAMKLASTLRVVHTAPAPPHLGTRRFIQAGTTLVLDDANFNEPVVIDDVSPKVLELLKSREGEECLLHGDFKANNIIASDLGLSIIDPKLCIGLPYIDIGKFLLRTLLVAPYPRNDILYALRIFVQSYAQRMGIDSEKVEQAAIVCGLVELAHLLSRPRRSHIEILGKEMPQLYDISDLVSHLSWLVLHEGNLLTIERLSFVMDDFYRQTST